MTYWTVARVLSTLQNQALKFVTRLAFLPDFSINKMGITLIS